MRPSEESKSRRVEESARHRHAVRPIGNSALGASIVLLVLALTSNTALARQMRPLNATSPGVWEAVWGELATPPGDDAGWAPAAVPAVGSWRPDGPHAIWYRRQFDVPTSWSTKQVVIRVGGAWYSQRVFVNGKLVGSHIGGFEPTEYDVTAHLARPGKNDLLIGVGDWTSLLVEPTKAGPPAACPPVESLTTGPLFAPVGAGRGDVGIWGDLTVEARPRVWLKEVQVLPRVDDRTLGVPVTVRNDTGTPQHVTISGRVADGGPGPRIAPAEVTVAPGKAETVTLEADWPDVRLWTPHDPHLYTLVVGLSVGTVVDSREVTFGFRDFRTEGDTFLLNGIAVHLLSAACTPTSAAGHSPEAVFAAARAAGATTVRLMGQPWPEEWYDAADRTGLLVIAESALSGPGSSYALSSDAFWTNARDHVAAMVRQLRHHPSVVMWSVERELLASGGAATKVAEQKVGDLIDLARQVDPTRPVMSAGDGDPAGKADAVSFHQPHDLSQWTAWPEAAFWFGSPVAREARATQCEWDRKKPLYLSELLRIPPTDVRSATILLGDAAYPDVHAARLTAQHAFRDWQIIAARDAGVSGISGWDIDLSTVAPLASEQRPAYHPVAAFDLSANAEVFAGSVTPRRLSVVNDTTEVRSLEVRWRLAPANGAWQVADAQLSLAPAGRQRVGAVLALPPLDSSMTPASFDLEVWEAGRRLFATSTEWHVHGRAALSGPVADAPPRIAVYDPDGETLRLLAQVETERELMTDENATQAARWADLMVIGKGALRASICPTGSPIGQAVLRHAQEGGTVLVFEQTAYPQWLIPLQLQRRSATAAFPRSQNHPVLEGLTETDLAHWQSDGLVCRDQIRKPDRVGFTPLVDSGSPEGLATTALAEMRVGEGRLLLCQLEVTDKYGLDPGATRITRNLLSYSGSKPRPLRRTAALVDDASAAQLDAVCRRYDRITGPLRRKVLAQYRVLVISDFSCIRGQEKLLQQFVLEGGHIVLHGVTPATVDYLADLMGQPMTLDQPPGGGVRLTNRSGPAVAMSNEELSWFAFDPHAGISTFPMACADYTILSPAAPGSTAYTTPAVLVSLAVGKGLWVVDQVRWDRPEGNDTQARRYLSALLTALGAE